MSPLPRKFRLGVQVFAGLAALTAVEWFAARWPGSLLWLGLIALGKTALIAEYFMHASQLLREEG
ncbi:MAG: cytochrome C oxidase subunit IV family protein [Armatimonadetes bacterium]|nr:cytochrome C oxidase subunit IV family protein [Armatimonadota bacterium]MDW8152689.1 cytochrome C oxidase subunit IV family protein [Armatimonadota bacterium]